MTGVHGLSNVQISQNIQSLPNKHIRNLSGQEMQNIKNISNISNHNIHLQTSIQTSHQTPQTVPNTIRPQINDNHLQTHELSLNFENSTSQISQGRCLWGKVDRMTVFTQQNDSAAATPSPTTTEAP